jgi:hypothetical protein
MWFLKTSVSDFTICLRKTGLTLDNLYKVKYNLDLKLEAEILPVLYN